MRTLPRPMARPGSAEPEGERQLSHEAKGWSEPTVALMVVYLYSLTPPESFVLEEISPHHP